MERSEILSEWEIGWQQNRLRTKSSLILGRAEEWVRTPSGKLVTLHLFNDFSKTLLAAHEESWPIFGINSLIKVILKNSFPFLKYISYRAVTRRKILSEPWLFIYGLKQSKTEALGCWAVVRLDPVGRGSAPEWRLQCRFPSSPWCAAPPLSGAERGGAVEAPQIALPRGMHLVFTSSFHQTETWNPKERSKVWSAENDNLEQGGEVLWEEWLLRFPGAEWRGGRQETDPQKKANPQDWLWWWTVSFSWVWVLPHSDSFRMGSLFKTPFWLFFPQGFSVLPT